MPLKIVLRRVLHEGSSLFLQFELFFLESILVGLKLLSNLLLVGLVQIQVPCGLHLFLQLIVRHLLLLVGLTAKAESVIIRCTLLLHRILLIGIRF